MSQGVDLGIAGLGAGILLGRGGFGAVYRCEQLGFGRSVAVKLLDGHLDAAGLARFERERQALGTLSSHPNIVTLYGSGINDDGQPYLIMEHVPRGSLAAVLRAEGPLGPERTSFLMGKVASAVHVAHQQEILHRDLKPENVLLSDFGEPLLADFGIARLPGAVVTSTSAAMTISYAAPELIQGLKATVASDVWALGALTHTLLTGIPPFSSPEDESSFAAVNRIMNGQPADLPRGTPDPVVKAVRSCLRRDPRERPDGADAFRHVLQGADSPHGLAGPTIRRSAEGGPDAPPPAHQTDDRGAEQWSTLVLQRSGLAHQGDVAQVSTEPACQGVDPPPVPALRRRWGRRRSVLGAVVLASMLLGGAALKTWPHSEAPVRVTLSRVAGHLVQDPTKGRLVLRGWSVTPDGLKGTWKYVAESGSRLIDSSPEATVAVVAGTQHWHGLSTADGHEMWRSLPPPEMSETLWHGTMGDLIVLDSDRGPFVLDGATGVQGKVIEGMSASQLVQDGSRAVWVARRDGVVRGLDPLTGRELWSSDRGCVGCYAVVGPFVWFGGSEFRWATDGAATHVSMNPNEFVSEVWRLADGTDLLAIVGGDPTRPGPIVAFARGSRKAGFTRVPVADGVGACRSIHGDGLKGPTVLCIEGGAGSASSSTPHGWLVGFDAASGSVRWRTRTDALDLEQIRDERVFGLTLLLGGPDLSTGSHKTVAVNLESGAPLGWVEQQSLGVVEVLPDGRFVVNSDGDAAIVAGPVPVPGANAQPPAVPRL